jgi:hypothetical protein
VSKNRLKAGAAIPAAAAAPKVNARGEGVLDLGDRKIKLALSLTALNAIETEFELDSITDLDKALDRPSAKKILFLLRTLADNQVTDEEILASPMAKKGLGELGALLHAVMSGDEPGKAPAPGM